VLFKRAPLGATIDSAATQAMRFLKRRGEGEQLQVDMEIFDVQGKGCVPALVSA